MVICHETSNGVQIDRFWDPLGELDPVSARRTARPTLSNGGKEGVAREKRREGGREGREGGEEGEFFWSIQK